MGKKKKNHMKENRLTKYIQQRTDDEKVTLKSTWTIIEL